MAQQDLPRTAGIPDVLAVCRTTHWSVVLAAAADDATGSQIAWTRLYETYWPALYGYVRRQGRNAEDAQDLVQDIFLTLIEKKQLSQVAPTRGRFRSYLLATARHALVNEWRSRNRQKRGGDPFPVDLDMETTEGLNHVGGVSPATPDLLYDQRWGLALLHAVLGRMKLIWRAAGKEQVFERLKPFLSGEQDLGDHERAAADLGLSAGAVRVTVHRLRQQYRELLRAEVAQTLLDPSEADDELRHLMAALRG